MHGELEEVTPLIMGTGCKYGFGLLWGERVNDIIVFVVGRLFGPVACSVMQ